MPQRRQVTWTDLRVGIFVLVGLFILAVGILYVTGTGTLAPKYRLRTYLPEVEGLTVGAPVRLDGVEVGNVERIRVNPRHEGRARNIELLLRINKDFQDNVRTDSTVTLVTEGLLGNRYVSIRRGETGTPIPADGEVPGVEEASTKAIVERGLELAQNLQVMTARVNDIIGGIERGQGTVGKLLADEALYQRAVGLVGRAENIVTRVEAGEGTLGKLVASDEIYRKANSAVGRADTLLADIQAQKGSLGKMLYDPGLHDNAKQFLERGNTLLTGIQQGQGTMGKLVTDDALYHNLRDAAANINSATAKLSQGQGTAGKFFTDPMFYDNLSGLAGDLRLLIGEFRQNPKKFLRVKFSLF